MKKYITPVIIILISVVISALYFLSPLHISDMSIIIKIIFFITFLCITGVLIAVLVQRIKEIKEEDPDDFSKY